MAGKRSRRIAVWAIFLSLAAAVAVSQETEPVDPGLAVLLGGGSDAGFRRATEPHDFAFPADHAAHPEYRNEWWYFTGNLDTASGREFGFELTFFRVGLGAVEPGVDASAWRSNQLLLAHFAISDLGAERFHVAQRYSRVALGLAGFRSAPFSLWLEDWELRHDQERDEFELAAAAEDFAVRLTLRPRKAPVLNGDRGLSQKSGAEGNASHYYSMSRLASRGEVAVGGERFAVSGDAWMDREWSTSALGEDQAGWDWFALQFDDNTELMFYQLRRKDGSPDRHSAGTYVDIDGNATHIRNEDVELVVLDEWRSPRGGVYPAGWTLRVESLGLDVEVRPRMADQELDTFPRYWEGAVAVSGSREGRQLGGHGYVELTGYADRPLPQ